MHVIVIGAGLIGTSAAYYLASAGCTVTVLERREGAGLETSFANSGMLTPSQADPWNAPGFVWRLLRWLGREHAPMLLRAAALPSLFDWGLAFARNSAPARYERNTLLNARLARYSLESLRELRAQLGLRYDEAERGTLKVFREPAALERALPIVRRIATAGTRFEIVEPDGIADVEPALAPIASKLCGGIYYPDDESGDAHRFTRALAEAAEPHVEFRYGTQVRRFVVRGMDVAGVQTDGEMLSADAYVLAAGPWSPQLARLAGIKLPVRPVKGYSVTLDALRWPSPPRVPVVDDTLHAAVTPLGSRIRVAGTAEFAGYDSRVRAARIDNLFGLLARLYPSSLQHLDRTQAAPWAGLRPMSADGVPIIGPCRIGNLFLNTGHGHLGWSMSVGSARALADHMLNRIPRFDLSAYNISRFD